MAAPNTIIDLSKDYQVMLTPYLGAGEAAQWLRALAALLEDLGSTPQHPHGSSPLSITPFPGHLTLSPMQAKHQ